MPETYFFIAGCLVTWLVTHFYYHRSSTCVPKWAEEFIRKLPAIPPTPSELLRLFQEQIDLGDIDINHPLGRVACPECGESAKKFEEKAFGDDYHTIIVYRCPSCGWSDHAEV